MNDRELLELAAKSAGIHFELMNDRAYMIVEEWSGNPSEDPEQRAIEWNPLTDDGDALRLAVKLRINVCHAVGGVYAEDQNSEIGVREPRADDANSATRRAIVRAAVQIGQSM